MSASLALALLLAVSGTLGLRLVRGGEPEPGVRVTLESAGVVLQGETVDDGVVRFLHVPPGAYVLKADSLELDLVLTSETEVLTLDLDAPAIYAGRFGRTTLPGKRLSRLPQAGTVSTVLVNQTLQTGENARSRATFREPTFVQPARTITLSGRLRF